MFAKSLFVTKKRPWSALILVSIMAVFHDKKKVRKMIPAAVLTVLLTLTLLPMTARAAQTYNAGSAAELKTALNSYQSGDTIRLTAGFTYNTCINISGKDVTFDLSGFTLNVEVTNEGQALWVGNATLSLAGTGALNIIQNTSSGGYGVYLYYGGNATVTNINSTGEGVHVYNGSCNLTVTGNITAQSLGIYFNLADDITITVGGDVTVSNGNGINVTGAVDESNTVTSFVNIGGNVTSGGYHSVGVYAEEAVVTIDGAIYNSGGDYIRVWNITKQNGEGTLDPAGDYIEYTNYLEKVRLKAYPLTIAAGAGGTAAINGVTGSSSKFHAGSSVGITASPNTGYHLSTWSSTSVSFTDASSAGTTFTMPRGAVTVQANFTVNTYQVNFDNQYGYIKVIQANYGATIESFSPPARTGDTFGGWYKEKACTNPWNFASDTVTGDTNLYAKWTINSYTVSFNSNGGSALSNQTVNYNATATKPTDPTRTGYTFAGWYSDEGLASAFSFTTVITNNITLYAKWNINSYTLTYNGNGNTGGSVPVDGSNHNFNSVVTVLDNTGNLTKTGYTFAGWNTQADGSGYTYAAGTGTFTMGVANVTLYAKWNINSYTVSFNSNGGTAVSSQTVNYNTTATKPTDPTRIGYTFAGWYSDGGLTSAFSFTTVITDNITLYAKWNINNYTVSFNSNGGSTVSNQSVVYNTVATLPANPTMTGYTFVGWYIDSGFNTAYSFTTPITGDITLYAKWSINSYTVTFDSNGGSEVTSLSVAHNTAAAAPADPARTGYTFAGWYNDSGLARAFSFTTLITDNITLYAKWTINSYAVIYDGNGNSGGSVAVDSSSHNFNTVVTVLGNTGNLTRTGYTFAGWNTRADGNGTNYTAGTGAFTMGAADVTLYAKWNINSYAVTYDGNGNSGGGAPVDSSSHNYNTVVTVLGNTGNLARTGYTFAGWNTRADGKGTSYTAGTGTFTMGAANVTLYAKWIEVRMVITSDQALSESGLNGRTICITLYGATLTATGTAGLKDFRLTPAIGNLSIDGYQYIDSTHCAITLKNTGGGLVSNTELQVIIPGSQLAAGNELTSENALIVSADLISWKTPGIYQAGSSANFKLLIANNSRNEYTTYWNGSALNLGKGSNGWNSDCWLYFPDVVSSIPSGDQVDRAELVLKLANIDGDLNTPRRLKVYLITDPDNYGIPCFGTNDGFRTGLNFSYRDYRPGWYLPWKKGAANILEMLGATEPLDVYEFIPAEYSSGLIKLDITAALQAWLNGKANQGLYIVSENALPSGDQLHFYGATAANATDRPYLQLIYANTVMTLNRPAKAANLTAQSTANSVTLHWDYAGQVRVLRKTGSVPFDPADGTLVYEGVATNFTDSGLDKDQTYYYAIFAYDSNRTYSPRSWVKAYTGDWTLSPVAPSGLTLSVQSATAINLSWTDNANNESGFVVERRTSGAGWTRIASLPAGQTAYQDNGLQPNSYYEYQIKAINPTGSSGYAYASATTGNELMAPANLTWKIISSYQVRLQWTVAPNAAGYRIQVLDGSGNVIKTIDNLAQSTNDYRVMGLTPETEYRFKVIAIQGANEAFTQTETIITSPDIKSGIL